MTAAGWDRMHSGPMSVSCIPRTISASSPHISSSGGPARWLQRAYMEGARSFVGMPLALASLALLTGASALGVVIEGFFGPGVHPFLEFRHFSVALLVILVGSARSGGWSHPSHRDCQNRPEPFRRSPTEFMSCTNPLLIQSNLTDSILGLLAMAILLVPPGLLCRPLPHRVLPRWESVKLRLSPSAA